MELGPGRLLRATAEDLPPAVASAMSEADPDLGRAVRAAVVSSGIPWSIASWGERATSAVLLIHGVTSNLETFWRLGPAIAATGRRVVAVDMPGHGRTGNWRGRHRFADTAADLAEFIRAAGLDDRGLAVLGHSWGAMIAAGLPAAGLQPARLILLDPPALPVSAMELMTHDPTERHYLDLDEARDAIRRANPGWPLGDVMAKASGLTEFDPEAARAVLIDNGDWDGGLGVLEDPAARDVPVWLIRGEFPTGGMIPDDVVPRFGERIGPDHVITIADGPHSPQRTHPEATVLAILQALGLA